MFEDRKTSQEAKFAHDAEKAFKALARRNKLAGHWAGELLGKNEAEREAYAGEIVGLVMSQGGAAAEEATVTRLVADLEGKASEAVVRAKLGQLMAEASSQVAAG